MTGLLTPPSTSSAGRLPDAGRPLVLGAVAAGCAAACAVLLGCVALALVAWFATEQGSHGTTRDALRIGSDAWLLAHGASLDVGVAAVTVVPLGLTLLCGHVCYRLGRWAGATSAADDGQTVALAAFVLAAVYALVALVTAILAGAPGAEPHLARAFAGGFVVALAGGGPGLLVGAGRLPTLLARAPEAVKVVAYAAAVAALAVVAAGGMLVAAALLWDLGEAATVLSGVDAGRSGGALMTLLVAGFSPNAALFGAAYLVGPGFSVGTGTVVSSGNVVLGPVPALPLLAALPGDGPAPSWALALLAVPVLAGALGGCVALRAHPCRGYEVAAARGLAGGAVAGLLLGVAMALSGGAVGPGRMADLGPAFLEPTAAAVVAMGVGAVLGALVTQWRQGPPLDGTEPTVELPDPGR